MSNQAEPSLQHKHDDAEQMEFQETDDDDYTSDDVRFAGKTLQEKKNLLIEREINKQGMGRYQWWIWSLCGLGYFLDLLWAQAIGLILVPMQNEFGFDDKASSNLFAVWSAGLCVGAFFFGYVIDVIGRYWAFNLTVLVSSVFGMALGAAKTYPEAQALAFLNGLGIGGNIPIDTTIALEFLPDNRRDLLPLLSIFQPLGVVVTTGLAYAFIPRFNCLKGKDLQSCAVSQGTEPPDCLPSCSDLAPGQDCCRYGDNMGWRYLLYTLGSISVAIFILRFVLFSFQESPKFLIKGKKDHLAINTVTYIAKFNKKPTNLTLQRFQELDRIEASKNGADSSIGPEEVGPPEHNDDRPNGRARRFGKVSKGISAGFGRWVKDLIGLFRGWPQAYLMIIILLIYAFDFWGFSIVGGLFPKILSAKNTDLGLSTDDTYRDYLIIYPPGIIGVLFGVVSYRIKYHGRQLGMLFSAAGYCASLFAFAQVDAHRLYVGINVLEYFSQSMFNSILYAWTPEAFPTKIRGTAAGAASSFGRAFSIFMPIAATQVIGKANGNGAIYLAGSGVAAMFICILLIPPRAFKPEEHRGK